MVVLTVVRSHPNWEAVYVDGRVAYQNHMDRVWPLEVLDIIEGKQIKVTEKIIAESHEEGHLPSTLRDADWYDGVLADG